MLNFACMTAHTQTIKVPEPDFVGVVVMVNPDDSTAQQLEKQVLSVEKTGSWVTALAKVSLGKTMNKVTGFASPTRTPHQPVRIIVTMRDNDRDPVEVVHIFKLGQDRERGRRFIIVEKAVLNKISTPDIKFITFHATKYGKNSYLLELSDAEKGEYALTLEGSRYVFNLFGID